MIWAPDRNRQQGQLVAELYRSAAGLPCDRSAVIAGGLPGADKTEAITQAGISASLYLTVSIDVVLTAMAARDLIPAAAGQSPLEAADLVHAEAQYLAKRIALLALTDGRNLILDVTLASMRSAQAWIYALRFAGYTVTAVFADIAVEAAVDACAAARRRGQEQYRRGQGYGGRFIPPEAIRALASPAGAVARNQVSWASGPQAEGGPAPAAGSPVFPGSAVTARLAAYRSGQFSREEVGLEFRVRRWPAVPSACPPGMEQARAAIDDLEPYFPGSFDDVVLAYDLGWLTDEDYEVFAAAAGPPGA